MLAFMRHQDETFRRWRGIIDRQAESGLSVAAFCRRWRISQPSFYAWRRRLREAATFTEVRLSWDGVPDRSTGQVGSAGATGSVGTADSAVAALELVLPSGSTIVVRPGFDRRTLLELVATLDLLSAHTPAYTLDQRSPRALPSIPKSCPARGHRSEIGS